MGGWGQGRKRGWKRGGDSISLRQLPVSIVMLRLRGCHIPKVNPHAWLPAPHVFCAYPGVAAPRSAPSSTALGLEMRDLDGLILGGRSGAQDTGGWQSQAKGEVQRVWVQQQETEEDGGDPGEMSEGHLVLVKLGSRRIRATRWRGGGGMQEGIRRVGFGV